ncbi:hypothetical protein TNCV_422501 [Trichonephila clavipes]|nr:hypothetical protein TNCV_422501 [Trichonephila clavipes]
MSVVSQPNQVKHSPRRDYLFLLRRTTPCGRSLTERIPFPKQARASSVRKQPGTLSSLDRPLRGQAAFPSNLPKPRHHSILSRQQQSQTLQTDLKYSDRIYTPGHGRDSDEDNASSHEKCTGKAPVISVVLRHGPIGPGPRATESSPKTRGLERRMHIKSVKAQSLLVGVMWKTSELEGRDQSNLWRGEWKVGHEAQNLARELLVRPRETEISSGGWKA